MRKTKAPPPVPPIEEREKPGLSETLLARKSPLVCQSCDCAHSILTPLARWQECDAWDKKTRVVVVLCQRCSDTLIESHPRLYHQLPSFAPFPGAMSICIDCRWRDGVTCNSPLWSDSGRIHISGGGVEPREEYLDIQYKESPVSAIVCGGPAAGRMTFYRAPAIACSGKVERPEA